MSAFVKSWSVGDGDMFQIKDWSVSGGCTLIDCCLVKERRDEILKDISQTKGNYRFISTHPDKDHILGIENLSQKLGAFWTTQDSIADGESDSDNFYNKTRNDKFYISAGSGISCEKHSVGINFLWPDYSTCVYQDALKSSKNTKLKNDLCPILTYRYNNEATFMWMGDLSTKMLQKIHDSNLVIWPRVDVLFAPHHGHDKVPEALLQFIQPKLIVLGEGDRSDMEYYRNYQQVCQNEAGDILFECVDHMIHLYVSGTKSESLLKKLSRDNDRAARYSWYVGTLNVDGSNLQRVAIQ